MYGEKAICGVPGDTANTHLQSTACICKADSISHIPHNCMTLSDKTIWSSTCRLVYAD